MIFEMFSRIVYKGKGACKNKDIHAHTLRYCQKDKHQTNIQTDKPRTRIVGGQ